MLFSTRTRITVRPLPSSHVSSSQPIQVFYIVRIRGKCKPLVHSSSPSSFLSPFFDPWSPKLAEALLFCCCSPHPPLARACTSNWCRWPRRVLRGTRPPFRAVLPCRPCLFLWSPVIITRPLHITVYVSFVPRPETATCDHYSTVLPSNPAVGGGPTHSTDCFSLSPKQKRRLSLSSRKSSHIVMSWG